MVNDGHGRQMANAPARTLETQTEIGLLGVDEEPFIEQARAQKGLATHEHERTGRPVAIGFPVVAPGIELALPEPTIADRPELGVEGIAERAAEAREVANGRPQGPVTRHLSHTDEPEGGTGVQCSDEPAKRPG